MLNCEHNNLEYKKFSNRYYYICIDCGKPLKKKRKEIPTYVEIKEGNHKGQIGLIHIISNKDYLVEAPGSHYFFVPIIDTIPIQFKNVLVIERNPESVDLE